MTSVYGSDGSKEDWSLEGVKEIGVRDNWCVVIRLDVVLRPTVAVRDEVPQTLHRSLSSTCLAGFGGGLAADFLGKLWMCMSRSHANESRQ